MSRVFVVASLGLLFGCDPSCIRHSDCSGGFRCVGGACVVRADPEADGGELDAALDGGTELDASNDGALNDGALNDGASNDGALNDGALNDGALNDGALDDGALNDAALDDGDAATPEHAA